MYLKEIRAHGFKSFADKITIVLADDITAIVGPNGSGKSNVVDAVKWVLGEQSVKNLRGSNNMSDVIFSGSKSRSPLNLASVTLVFDNQDNYLKVPFTEISITRKVYRSGENEYFINNEKCRLKDISDLFLDSGMGKYAFNIISQGEVSKIISDSPLDRRAIFEEAAGVLKYKNRKNEALRKLEKTNENLVRVNDIVKELENQIEPLKEQSDKAKEYISVKEQLENIEIALIASDLERLDLEYKDGLKKKDDLENKIAEVANTSSNNDALVSVHKKELNDLDTLLVKLNNKYLDLVKELEKLNGEKNIINERMKYKADDLKIHENITNLKEQSLISHNKLLSLETDLKIINNQIKDIDLEIDKKRSILNDCQNKKNNFELKLDSLNRQITDNDYRIKTLTSYIENNGSLPSSVKKVLSNPKLNGIYNVVGKLIDTEEPYATALEIALSFATGYVVVKDKQVAKEAINYLKDNNLGRVTFYPISEIKPRYVDQDTISLVSNFSGYIDTLANLCSCDDKFKDIKYNLLGNVLLVDNLDNANYISSKIHNRYKIVTLDGDVINAGGSVTGGSFTRKSVISEKYELNKLINDSKNLTDEALEVQKDLDETNINFQNIYQDINNTEKERLILEGKITVKKDEMNELSKSYDKISLELSNLQGVTNESIKEEEEKVINKYYEVALEKDRILKEIEVNNAKKDKINSDIEELNATIKISNTDLRSIDEELKNLEINNTKISIKMDSYLNTLADTYTITFEKAKANYILDVDYNIAKKNVNEFKLKIKRLGDVNPLAIDEYDRISKRYDFLAKQSDDLKGAIETLLTIINELDKVMADSFIKTFKKVEIEFNNVFKDLFGGGFATLKLTDKENLLETGVDIVVSPPGKKVSTISLLSGGEKTLTAISLLFAILNIKNIPFCIFDEIEAALDEANVDKVGNYFKKYQDKTQLIIITHKKKTMEYANTLYGITMQESGVSKLVSVKLG